MHWKNMYKQIFLVKQWTNVQIAPYFVSSSLHCKTFVAGDELRGLFLSKAWRDTHLVDSLHENSNKI